MNQDKPIESKDYGVRAKQGKGKAKVAEPVKAKSKKKPKGY